MTQPGIEETGMSAAGTRSTQRRTTRMRPSKEPTNEAEVPLTVVLVRHGQPDLTKRDGEMGPPLTLLGRRQASSVAERLAAQTFDHIYSSDLVRARETAEYIRRFHQPTPFTVTPHAREVTTHHFLSGAVPEAAGVRSAVRRERKVLRQFVSQLHADHPYGERLLIICHANFIRTVIPMLGGKSARRSVLLDVCHASVTSVDVWPSGVAVLRSANSVSHLLPSQVSG